MALEAVGSNPTIHPIFIRTACVRYSGFDYRMRAIIILGCRQAVRQRTLTPSLRWFESSHPSHEFGPGADESSRPFLFENRVYSQGGGVADQHWFEMFFAG